MTISFEVTTAPEFLVGVWDFATQQYVEVFQGPTSPFSGDFYAKGVFALVVFVNSGEGDYVMTLDVDEADGQVPEREPNEFFYSGRYLGELLVGDHVIARGEGDAATDEFDSVIVTCPSAVRLETIAAIPPTGIQEDAEFDILVYDLTGGEAEPPLIGQFIWGGTGAARAEGVVDVPAGSLVQVYVFAFTGDATWTLSLRGLTPGAGPLAAAARPRGPRPPAAPARSLPDFGRVTAELVAGQVLAFAAHDPAQLARDLERHGCRVRDAVPGGCCRASFELPAGLDEDERRRRTVRRIHCLARCASVACAEPNFVRRPLADPDDTFYNLQWHFGLINLPQAWDLTTGNSDVIVAVLDTGSTDHPDLAGREIAGYDFISDPDRAIDGDGLDDDPTDPGDKGSPGGVSSFHGTHVAGTIGAETNNGEGVAAVTWATGIMHLRVLGKGGGTDFDIANAILYAAGLANSSGALPERKAHVINMSLGGPGFNQAVADAVTAARQAGVVIFAASGNDDTTAPAYPAAYEGVVSVGSVDLNGLRAPYSNYGPTLDIVAPGGDTSQDANLDGWPDGVLSIRVANVGGGELEVGPVEVVLPPGQSWLQATLLPGSEASTSASAVELAVDRTDLADGAYFGRVQVESNGGTRQIQVLLRVLAVPPGPPFIDILVRAVAVDTGQVVRETVVNPATGLDFRLADVPPGTYRIEAGTDLDFDGTICEGGELCGAYPTIDFPILVEVVSGTEQGPLTFTVAPSGILPAAAGEGGHAAR